MAAQTGFEQIACLTAAIPVPIPKSGAMLIFRKGTSGGMSRRGRGFSSRPGLAGEGHCGAEERTMINKHAAKKGRASGPFSDLRHIYTYCFMSAAIALYSVMKKRILRLRCVITVIAISATNLVVWTMERFIGSSFEFLSASYAVMAAMRMILYAEMTENGLLNCFRFVSDKEDEKAEKNTA